MKSTRTTSYSTTDDNNDGHRDATVCNWVLRVWDGGGVSFLYPFCMIASRWLSRMWRLCERREKEELKKEFKKDRDKGKGALTALAGLCCNRNCWGFARFVGADPSETSEARAQNRVS